jgi:hypothetical protein
VDSGSSKEAEAVFAEAVEVGASLIIELGSDLLEAGEIPVLSELGFPTEEVFLVLVELGVAGQAPKVPLGAAVVAAIGAEAVAASRIAAGQLDRMGDVEIARSLPPRIPRGPDIEAF